MLFSFFYDCFDYINVFLRKFAVLIKFLVCIDMLPPRHNPLRQQKSRKIMRLSHHRHKRKSTLLNRGLVTERSLEGFPVSLSQFFYRPVDGFSLTGTSSLVIVQVFPRWLTLELKPFGTSSSRTDQLYFSFCHCNPLLSDSIRFGQDTKLTAAQPQKNCCYAPPSENRERSLHLIPSMAHLIDQRLDLLFTGDSHCFRQPSESRLCLGESHCRSLVLPQHPINPQPVCQLLPAEPQVGFSLFLFG